MGTQGQAAQAVDVFGRRELGGAGGGRAFEQPPDVERVVDLLHRDAGHEIAVPDDAIEVALLPEAREPLADGRPAHAVLAREADLGQRRARAVSALDDAGLEIAVRALDVRRIGGAAAGRRAFTVPPDASAGEYTDRIQPAATLVRAGRSLPCYPDSASPSRLTRGSFDQPIRGGNDSCARVCLRLSVSLRRPVRRRPAEAQYGARPQHQSRHGRDLSRRDRRVAFWNPRRRS